MTYVKAFIAGFASTLVFHQGLLWLLYGGGFSPQAPWNMTPVPPFHRRRSACACVDDSTV